LCLLLRVSTPAVRHSAAAGGSLRVETSVARECLPYPPGCIDGLPSSQCRETAQLLRLVRSMALVQNSCLTACWKTSRSDKSQSQSGERSWGRPPTEARGAVLTRRGASSLASLSRAIRWRWTGSLGSMGLHIDLVSLSRELLRIPQHNTCISLLLTAFLLVITAAPRTASLLVLSASPIVWFIIRQASRELDLRYSYGTVLTSRIAYAEHVVGIPSSCRLSKEGTSN